jgi:hypothetical protein
MKYILFTLLLAGCYDKHDIDRAREEAKTEMNSTYLRGLLDANERVRNEWIKEQERIMANLRTWDRDSINFHQGYYNGLFRAKTQIEVMIMDEYQKP